MVSVTWLATCPSYVACLVHSVGHLHYTHVSHNKSARGPELLMSASAAAPIIAICIDCQLSPPGEQWRRRAYVCDMQSCDSQHY